MLLSTFLKRRDKGFASGTIFKAHSKRNTNEPCKRRGISTLNAAKECEGHSKIKYFSNTNTMATSLNKNLFKYDSLNKVSIFVEPIHNID